MGYTLKIGEAELSYETDYVCIDCATVEIDSAPAYGEPTDRQNQRWPSYSSWHDCMKTLGLMDVMFCSRNGGGGFDRGGDSYEPLLASHPGAMPVTKAHAEEVEERLAAYKKKHPTHRAEYPPPKQGAKPMFGSMYRNEDLETSPEYDGSLCRGEWLAYWLRWAVENCKQPVFVNS